MEEMWYHTIIYRISWNFISADDISVDQRKIVTIRDWPAPINISELCSFLELASYYRKFVKGFLAIASPLTVLLHKDTRVWMVYSSTTSIWYSKTISHISTSLVIIWF